MLASVLYAHVVICERPLILLLPMVDDVSLDLLQRFQEKCLHLLENRDRAVVWLGLTSLRR